MTTHNSYKSMTNSSMWKKKKNLFGIQRVLIISQIAFERLTFQIALILLDLFLMMKGEKFNLFKAK